MLVEKANAVGCDALAAENVLSQGHEPKKHPSEAEALVPFVAFTAQLKSFPDT
jgi:hypothetical protein